jgi:kynurenine formamidase
MKPAALAGVILALIIGSAGPLQPPAGSPTVVDLGHPLSDADPSWTGQKVFTWSVAATMDKDGYFAGRFATDEHFGTHLDAPAHFAPKGWTVDQIPADRLVRPGVALNVEEKVRANDDYQVTLADVHAFEQRHGPIPEGAIVLVATGWDRRWIDPRQYMNERGGVKHFPGVAPETAGYLARTRKIAGLGIDTPSVDYGPSRTFETHRTTQPLNVYHIENAARLTTLPPTGFTVVVAPVKIRGGSGGPARVFALVPRAG